MSREQITTDCIIIKRINYRDADRIITVYSKDLGKVSIIAKGLRKISSKNKGHLELFNNTRIQLIKSHNWYIAAQAKTDAVFTNLKSNHYKINQGYYVLEIFDKLVHEGEKHEILYDLLLKTIRYINDTESDIYVLAFNVKLLKILGFYSTKDTSSIPHKDSLLVDRLVESTYEELNIIDTSNKEQIQKVHDYLKTYTESVIEKDIKTEVSFSSLP